MFHAPFCETQSKTRRMQRIGWLTREITDEMEFGRATPAQQIQVGQKVCGHAFREGLTLDANKGKCGVQPPVQYLFFSFSFSFSRV